MFINNAFMAPKDKFNLSLPSLLMKEFNRISSRYGAKTKWAVFAAAMAKFATMTQDDQDEIIDRVIHADTRKTYDVMLAKMRDEMLAIPALRPPLPSIPFDGEAPPAEPDEKQIAPTKGIGKRSHGGRSK